MSVVLINDESLNINRNQAYKDSREEKMTRGLIKATCDRHISKSTIVICDSLNYIKGYRYELWCSSRSAATPSCVVWVKQLDTTVKAWNESNPNEDAKWNPDLLSELVMRFEPPASSRRWENPTFEIEEGEELPFSAITAHVTATFSNHISMATSHNKIGDANYLHDLDKVTQDIIKAFLESQKETAIGSLVTVPNSKKKLKYTRQVGMAELRRLRQQYISLSRSLSQTKNDFTQRTQTQLADEFVDYLNASLA
eukprot:TRINITY_DN3928_c0_g1_i2.p1 TRINITY_DN3928_c0_g1~~TRINITY_DN3928_c0_g1_i2.p1  ORF type:complete len:254 (-),score=42.09 TRINITY_DN3928_c0_g1_i2:22-783(-)